MWPHRLWPSSAHVRGAEVRQAGRVVEAADGDVTSAHTRVACSLLHRRCRSSLTVPSIGIGIGIAGIRRPRPRPRIRCRCSAVYGLRSILSVFVPLSVRAGGDAPAARHTDATAIRRY